MSGEKGRNKKILICGIVMAAILVIGGAIAVIYSMNKEETTQEEEMEEEDEKNTEKKPEKTEAADSDGEASDKEDIDLSQLGGLGEYVDTSRKNKDCMTIGSMMDVLQIAAADPAITWKTEEVVVIFTQDGLEYQSENADVIKFASDTMPPDTTKVSRWSDGWEIRAQKDLSTGVPIFSFRGDYEVLKELKPELAAKFDIVLDD